MLRFSLTIHKILVKIVQYACINHVNKKQKYLKLYKKYISEQNSNKFNDFFFLLIPFFEKLYFFYLLSTVLN